MHAIRRLGMQQSLVPRVKYPTYGRKWGGTLCEYGFTNQSG